MLKKLIPQEKGFFNLFQDVAKKVVDAAEKFNHQINDLPNAPEYAIAIEQYAREGDKITRQTFDLLHKTFITPFDRYDIHKLASKLDDVLDLLNTTSKKITLYQLQSLPSEIQSLAQVVVDVTRSLKSAIHRIDSFKYSEEILDDCREIIAGENEAEQLGLLGLARLFEEEKDFKNLLKTKEVYESIKRIIDKSQNLAYIIKGIILEYA